MVQRALGPIKTTEGKIFVRQEYMAMYDRMVKGANEQRQILPGVIITGLGVWLGQIYMKAQLAVKREMSNARAPVLGHFGAAVAGLST